VLNTYAGALHPHGAKLYLAMADGAFSVKTERAAPKIPADNDYSITILTIGATGLHTIDTGSGWTPANGDAIEQNGSIYIVRFVQTATQFLLNTDAETGAATAYDAFSCVVRFTARDAGNPMAMKLWRDGLLLWDSIEDVYSYTLAFASDVSVTETSETRTLDPTIAQGIDNALPVRFFVPREHARSAVLFPRITIAQARAAWRLAGLSLQWQSISKATRREYA
jgi:hypothetical protein